MIQEAINNLVDRALLEDVGDGDHSSLASVPHNAVGRVRLLIKEDGVIAGLNIAKMVFARIDSTLEVLLLKSDGDLVRRGDFGMEVSGSQLSLLKAERLVLNIMQRMSGIATETRRYADALSGYRTKVLDTRKTTPGFRIFEKEAVRIGGGENHRMGLYDMIMLKDNHIDFAGGIEKAIQGAVAYNRKTGRNLKIEIEARSIEDIERILSSGGVDRIMLDNFSPALTRQAVELIGGRYETESSGGITFESLAEYAECGVDYISVGALTHHVKSLDMSLKAV